jgi:hypothetical protein
VLRYVRNQKIKQTGGIENEAKKIEQCNKERREDYKVFSKYKKQLFDEFGNQITAYEVVHYEKCTDGGWVEYKRYDTLEGNDFIIDEQLYF